MTTNDELIDMHADGMSYADIAEAVGMTKEAVRSRLRYYERMKKPIETPVKVKINESPFPRFTEPLSGEGDFLCLFDPEFPFHHADFLNRCLDLAQAWNITQCAIGGDVLHMETFSAWGASWQSGKIEIDSLTKDSAQEMLDEIQKLPPEYQGPLLEKLNRIISEPTTNDEILLAQRELKKFEQLFGTVLYILGNHDDRFLRRLNSPLAPQKLLDFIGLSAPCWKIGPYFYGIVTSGGETFRLEHPRSAAQNTALRLADKNECSAIVGHDHYQDFKWSSSGKHYAIHAGCTCDETRMPYASQRSTNRPAHVLGAVVLREGVPYLLHPRVNWERLKRM